MLKNSFLNVHDVVLLFTIIEIPFLCALLKLLPSRNGQPRNILICFFILIAGTLVTTVITWNSSLQTMGIAKWDGVLLILASCMLLQGPTLYFYLRSLSQSIGFWSVSNIIHIVPAIVVCITIIAFDIRVADWRPETWLGLGTYKLYAIKAVMAVIKCLPLLYVIACLYIEYKSRNELKAAYSNASALELRCADIVLIGFLAQWLWSFLMYFLSDYINYEMNDLLGILNNYLTVILVNVLFFFGVSNTRQLMTITVVEEKVVEAPRIDNKVLAVEQGIKDKLYLDSHINLERFAEHIGLKPREVSSILSGHYQSNFFEFINGYRVAEAKRLLTAPECQKDTIQDVIFKAGFNSQSAFHRFFKRIVGVTPSEYRNQARENTP